MYLSYGATQNAKLLHVIMIVMIIIIIRLHHTLDVAYCYKGSSVVGWSKTGQPRTCLAVNTLKMTQQR